MRGSDSFFLGDRRSKLTPQFLLGQPYELAARHVDVAAIKVPDVIEDLVCIEVLDSYSLKPGPKIVRTEIKGVSIVFVLATDRWQVECQCLFPVTPSDPHVGWDRVDGGEERH